MNDEDLYPYAGERTLVTEAEAREREKAAALEAGRGGFRGGQLYPDAPADKADDWARAYVRVRYPGE